jgi:hypothetical protein
MAQITPDPIMRIAMGFMAAKHLFVANEIGLFTGPAQGRATLHELAAICGIPLRTAGISADAMVSLGLSAGVEAFPRRRQRHWRPITIFRGIAGCSTLEAAPARFSSQSCDGTLRCAAPCSSCRCLRGGASSARRRARGGRIDLVEGDFVSDPLPPGHDVLLLANTVHVLSAAQNLELLRKLRVQAPPGTHLLLVDLWMDSGHTQPPAAPLMSGEFLIISGEGQAYGEDGAEAWRRETGWRNAERRSLGGPHSMIVAEAI